MDIATVIGFVGTMGLIAWAMDSEAGISAFVDTSSVVIVFAGSIMVLLMRSTLPEFINAWAKVLMKAFLNKNEYAVLLAKSQLTAPYLVLPPGNVQKFNVLGSITAT